MPPLGLVVSQWRVRPCCIFCQPVFSRGECRGRSGVSTQRSVRHLIRARLRCLLSLRFLDDPNAPSLGKRGEDPVRWRRWIAVAMTTLSTVVGACSRGGPGAPERRTASTHPMEFYVSLPRGWSPDRTWPVVLTIAGSAKNWLANAKQFASARDSLGYPFIIVTPVVLANCGRDLRGTSWYDYAPSVWDLIDREGRCTFDLDGVRAVIADVARLYHGQTKPFITGFSAGGNLSNSWALVHPEMFRGVATSAGNYTGRCVTDEVPVPQPISSAPERVGLPIRFFNGSDDQYRQYLIPQRDDVVILAKSHGFANVSETMLPNMPHAPMPGQVLREFASQLAPSER